jgi:uncharacterized membrane protein YhhN
VDDVTDPITVFVLAVGAAMFAGATGGKRLFAVAKPVATLSLIGVAWRSGGELLTALVVLGLVLSLAGDVALLSDRPARFLLGLFLFFAAHLAYAAAFLLRGVGSLWTPAVGIVVFGAASGWLVGRLWGRVDEGLHGPVMLYASAITAMTAGAFATLAGRWPAPAAAAAAAGALFFFFSDAMLAWNRFVEPFRYGQAVTLLLYWLGQLGIALGARWAGGW